MKVYIYAGPTLTPAEIRSELDAICMPPVSEGDIYRATLQRPLAIGIIDGYFHRVPAVWHKEILWALSQGIAVYGSASMGAMRAAELAPFGMKGVGTIFEAYRDGLLEDDDEVALIHAPAEAGHIALSEPMVNIRAKLAHAEQLNVITAKTSSALCALAKSLFYPERTYAHLLEIGEEHGIPTADILRLKDWLPGNTVNRKREDALLMLRVMQDDLVNQRRPEATRFTFEHTIYWDRASLLASVGPVPERSSDTPLTFDALLDELRLNGDAFSREFEGALLRELILETAVRQRLDPPNNAIRERAAEFRRQHNLQSADAFTKWLSDQHIEPGDFARLMREDVLIDWVTASLAGAVLRRLPDLLRLTGRYRRYWDRAVHKYSLLKERAQLNPSLSGSKLSAETVIDWYFATLGVPIPANIAEYAVDIGFENDDAFMSALLKEWLYVQSNEARER